MSIKDKLRQYQKEAHDAVMAWVKQSTDPCLLEAATGCHEPGHPILMNDGTVKKVEEVAVGDQLMGPDGNPRTVLELHSGQDEMYEVTPTKGEVFRVNAGHIFSAYVTPRKSGQSPGYSEFTAKEHFEASPYFRHLRKIQRVPVDFPISGEPLIVPPYVVGAMIGDGCMTQLTPSFTTMDEEVCFEVKKWALSIGCHLNRFEKRGSKAWMCSIVDPKASRSTESRARKALSTIGIYGHYAEEKGIPDPYKTSTRLERLELIAGLVDTDGSATNGGYDWISKSESLAIDLVFLCRSVGLAAYTNKCVKSCQNGFTGTYYRVSISGDCGIIPVRVPRRKIGRREQKKRVDVTGFKTRPVGRGGYYGFTLDGDNLYLDGYFVRHHNSGKSMIIASVANDLYRISGGKKVLCTAPNADLVIQNREKYQLTGEPAGIFSASAGERVLRHPIVFGTPGTIIKRIRHFQQDYCAIIIDEAHGLTPTLLTIIEKMREGNPNLRVIGTTATPFRLGSGYIYAMDEAGRPMGDQCCRDPYFTAKVYTVGAHSLIDQGFLTKPVVGQIGGDHYDTLGMEVNGAGQFNKTAIDRAYHGHGRKTAHIVSDVVAKSKNRKGVMLFAATVQHAQEIIASLPPGLSRMIGGAINTKRADRKKLVADFKAQRFKYLVSVATMTTGVDFTHVDVIALLRATESVSLLQQIIGRGLRLHEGKENVLILDYAENLERHCPDGDIFNPEIKASFKGADLPPLEACCPSCGTTNTFASRKNEDGFKVSDDGYFLDLAGNKIETEHGHMPAHYGRRCQGLQKQGPTYVQCDYRWTMKKCPGCGHENDIAAKYCESCRGEIVDPGEKLRLEFKQLKRDPTQVQCDEVIGWSVKPTVSRKGNECLVVNYVTPYRSFTVWYHPTIKGGRPRAQWLQFDEATQGGESMPSTVQYSRDKESKFYNVHAYNVKPDVDPDKENVV